MVCKFDVLPNGRLLGTATGVPTDRLVTRTASHSDDLAIYATYSALAHGGTTPLGARTLGFHDIVGQDDDRALSPKLGQVGDTHR